MSLTPTEDISNLMDNVNNGWTVYNGAVATDEVRVDLNGGSAKATIVMTDKTYSSKASALTIYVRYWNSTNANAYVRVQYNSKVYTFNCSKLDAAGDLYFFEVPMETIVGSATYPTMAIDVYSEGGNGQVYLEVAFRKAAEVEVTTATYTNTGITRPVQSWGMKVATEDDETTGRKAGDIGVSVDPDQFEITEAGAIKIKDGVIQPAVTQITSIEVYSDGFSYNNTYGFQTLENGNIVDLATGNTIPYTQYTDSILNHLGGSTPPPASEIGTRNLSMNDTLTPVATADTLQTFFTANGKGTFAPNDYDVIDTVTGDIDPMNGGAIYVSTDGGPDVEIMEYEVFNFNTKLEVKGTYSATHNSETGNPMGFYFAGAVTIISV